MRGCAPWLLALFSLFSGCFSPRQPACAFACVAPPHSCPSGYTCGNDGICHSDNNQGECPLSGQDGGINADGSASER